MWLTNREQEKLMLYTAAKLATERKERGIKLNFPEATAVISFFILEGAKDGKSVADLMVEAKSLLKEDDVMEGVTEMIETVQVEATFDDGTKLVTIHQPISKNPPSNNPNKKPSLIPGEYLIDSGELDLNSGDSINIEVENQGDRPVQVGSHYHFFEVNRFLSFSRENAYGKRLDIPSGTSIRFEPGSKKSVNLVDYTGSRYMSGFNGLVEGQLDDEAVKKSAMEKLNQFLGELK